MVFLKDRPKKILVQNRSFATTHQNSYQYPLMNYLIFSGYILSKVQQKLLKKVAYSALQIFHLPKIHLRYEFQSMLMRIFSPNCRAVTNDRTKSCRKAFFPLFSFKCRYCAKSVTICLSKIPK